MFIPRLEDGHTFEIDSNFLSTYLRSTLTFVEDRWTSEMRNRALAEVISAREPTSQQSW